ncbi:DUF885 family protein [Granulicella sp. S190]|uniref:DUF885 domain-containing protein n=1 Tax=Granulicella sp. S190 TaxID=1747226 RepID=UPI00131D3541|nr:DUF885 domain-containing protein [Granulicella sp. S190]
MRFHLLTLVLATSLCASLPPWAHASSVPVETRIAAQNALFEEIYQADLKKNPERATAVGDYRYNDKLADYSLAAIVQQNADNQADLRRLSAIDATGFPEQDLLSHQLMERRLKQNIEDFGLKNYEMSVNQQNGIHTSLSDLPLAVPLDTVQHYDDYIARLHQIPRVLAQSTDVLRLGLKDNLMPPRFLLEQVAHQASDIAATSPFLIAIKKIPASFSDADRQRLTTAIQQTVDTEVSPAYRTFATFIANDYAPHGRTAISVSTLPDGKHRYEVAVREQTTTDMTPAQIHQLGLDEITRITAEMTTIAHKAGFKDLESFRASIKANPKYTPTSSEEILDTFRHYIAQMQPKLPELFTVLPDCPVTVEAIPAYQAAAATHYQTGTPDCKRPGRVSVGVSDFAHRSLINDEAIAYHEGIPGHHMQRSVQQQLKGLPQFRIHGGGFTAYTEGWALYAEQLGKDVGFYQDPVSDYGRLSSELFRAVRLVVDTGIHSQGWTREQVVALFEHTDSLQGPEIQSETDRYIAWPGQALAYKIGQLKFIELRERAKRELGPNFDLRAFHDEMLSAGVLPLDLLEQRTNHWIAAQKSKVASVSVPVAP